MNIKQIHFKLIVLSLFFFVFLGYALSQVRPRTDFGEYKRVYLQDNKTYEIVNLLSNGEYTQKLYKSGHLRYSNSGKWKYIATNKNNTSQWRNGNTVVLFSDWLRGDELLLREEAGDSTEIAVLKKWQPAAAVVLSSSVFSFDNTGASDYIKQSN